jgi:hypothetical protein
MTVPLLLSAIALTLAAVPTALFIVNLFVFRRLPAHPAAAPPPVSILIPARDEGETIGACVEAALSSRHVACEIVVLNDHSRDDTAHIVQELAARDSRVRLEVAPPLPRGWCGKQHACHALSMLARHDLLLFIDADVRLSPDAAARAVGYLQRSNSDLISGFPRQEMESLLEMLLIPLIHVVLLGYLPIPAMRWRSNRVAYGAGCGQFFLARRGRYVEAGGHGAIRRSLHDGLTLPRAFRAAGFRTDIFDATDTAACRMYRGNRACWAGLAKNATEGMGSPRAIVVWTVLLLGGHVLPFVMLGVGFAMQWRTVTLVAGAAATCVLAIRLVAAVRFRQKIAAALLYPLAVSLLVAVQWDALFRRLFGRPSIWKGRAYAHAVAD